MRGYFAVGIENPKKEVNIGTLWRSAYSFGASFIFTIGNKYHKQSSDTTVAYKSIPLFHYTSFGDFYEKIPLDSYLVGVELLPEAREIKNFCHPDRAIYLLGNESVGLSKEALDKCHLLVKIPGKYCLNVSIAGTILLYDRINKSKT